MRNPPVLLLAALLHCGGSVAPGATDAGIGNDAPQPTCTDGQTKEVGCNPCTCSNGAWACTDMPCIDPSDPGSVTCGGATCATADHFCCDQYAESCQAKPEPGSCVGARRVCDEAADCPGGQVCCIPPNPSIVFAYATRCAASCVISDRFQVCKTSAECQNGMPCIGQPCLGKTIYTCGGAIPAKDCP